MEQVDSLATQASSGTTSGYRRHIYSGSGRRVETEQVGTVTSEQLEMVKPELSDLFALTTPI
ncbi:uncharacterized protein CTRU02_215812 [Colletotrichum truncatum]|uniref:Uncharacterized protein n=1 Tax=Colletotrichum truncatum TaxID=5467 RepID=A0ACC3YBQ2_COLTU|nr:uncharacterized protein CTRU02_15552 [Colletotrichum truncatum]KAF6780931.1 hypothetical protein CTRU02_15552 [Colletotrichum truncatum]